MVWLSMLTAAIAPGLALLAYFYLKDKYDTEPIKMVAKLFFIGLLTVIPTMFVQRGIILAFGESQTLTFSFVLSSGLEEAAKWIVLFWFIFHHKVFDEPYDGIVYAVAVSLGFATIENVFYAMFYKLSIIELMYRALLPVSGHALFGVMMGYYLGKAKFTPAAKNKFLFLSIFFPLLWHGLFDYVLLTAVKHWTWFIVPFMAYMWIKVMRKVEQANNKSPFRSVYRDEEINFASNGQ